MIFRRLIGFLLCSMSFLSLTAQTDTIDVDLENVVVSAHRSPVLYSQSARLLRLISAEEIAASPAASLDDLLNYTLNVDVRQRGAQGVQADVSMRGGSSEQTLILLNGIPMNDPQTGHHNLNLPASMSDIQRIEVLEGPGSRVYGPNAFSGAINIITKPESHKHLRLSMALGKHRLSETAISAAYGNEKWQNQLTVSHKRSDGYRHNTDFKTTAFFYQGHYSGRRVTYALQAGCQDKAFGANGFYSAAFPEQYEETAVRNLALGIESGQKLKFKSNLAYRQHQDYFLLERDDPDFYKNLHLSNVLTWDNTASYASRWGKSAVGFQYRFEHLLSSSLGDELASPQSAKGYDGQYSHYHQRTTANFFVEHNYYHQRWSLSGGFLSSWNSAFAWHNYGGIDVAFECFDGFRLFASLNESLRLPTFTDLYYSSRANVGNPDLKAEQALTIESGLKYRYRSLSGHLAVFRRYGRDIIDWVKDPENPRTSINSAGKEVILWETANHTRIVTDGFEGRLSYRTSSSFIKMVNVSFSLLNSDKIETEVQSKYALDYLKNSLSLGIHHRVYRSWALSWQFVHNDRAGSYLDADNNQHSYTPYTTVDARLYRQSDRFLLYVSTHNLFEVSYHSVGHIPMPGRWVQAGLMVDLWALKEK